MMTTNFLDRLKSRVAEVAEQNYEKVKHLIAPEEVQEERIAVCQTCEYYFKPTGQCKKCGCFVKIKASLAPFACPVNKWGEYKQIIPIEKQE